MHAVDIDTADWSARDTDQRSASGFSGRQTSNGITCAAALGYEVYSFPRRPDLWTMLPCGASDTTAAS